MQSATMTRSARIEKRIEAASLRAKGLSDQWFDALLGKGEFAEQGEATAIQLWMIGGQFVAASEKTKALQDRKTQIGDF